MPRHCQKFHLGEDETHFHSGIDGSLYIPGENRLVTHDGYCVDYFYYKDESDPTVDVIKVKREKPRRKLKTENNFFFRQVETLVCFDDNETAWIILKFKIYATLLAISAAFLGVTFLVYIFLVKPLNLHGKTLACHVLSLFVAYSSLSAVQFATDVKVTYCKCIGETRIRRCWFRIDPVMNHILSISAYIVFFSFLSGT